MEHGVTDFFRSYLCTCVCTFCLSLSLSLYVNRKLGRRIATPSGYPQHGHGGPGGRYGGAGHGEAAALFTSNTSGSRPRSNRFDGFKASSFGDGAAGAVSTGHAGGGGDDDAGGAADLATQLVYFEREELDGHEVDVRTRTDLINLTDKGRRQYHALLTKLNHFVVDKIEQQVHSNFRVFLQVTSLLSKAVNDVSKCGEDLFSLKVVAAEMVANAAAGGHVEGDDDDDSDDSDEESDHQRRSAPAEASSSRKAGGDPPVSLAGLARVTVDDGDEMRYPRDAPASSICDIVEELVIERRFTCAHGVVMSAKRTYAKYATKGLTDAALRSIGPESVSSMNVALVDAMLAHIGTLVGSYNSTPEIVSLLIELLDIADANRAEGVDAGMGVHDSDVRGFAILRRHFSLQLARVREGVIASAMRCMTIAGMSDIVISPVSATASAAAASADGTLQHANIPEDKASEIAGPLLAVQRGIDAYFRVIRDSAIVASKIAEGKADNRSRHPGVIESRKRHVMASTVSMSASAVRTLAQAFFGLVLEPPLIAMHSSRMRFMKSTFEGFIMDACAALERDIGLSLQDVDDVFHESNVALEKASSRYKRWQGSDSIVRKWRNARQQASTPTDAVATEKGEAQGVSGEETSTAAHAVARKLKARSSSSTSSPKKKKKKKIKEEGEETVSDDASRVVVDAGEKKASTSTPANGKAEEEAAIVADTKNEGVISSAPPVDVDTKVASVVAPEALAVARKLKTLSSSSTKKKKKEGEHEQQDKQGEEVQKTKEQDIYKDEKQDTKDRQTETAFPRADADATDSGQATVVATQKEPAPVHAAAVSVARRLTLLSKLKRTTSLGKASDTSDASSAHVVAGNDGDAEKATEVTSVVAAAASKLKALTTPSSKKKKNAETVAEAATTSTIPLSSAKVANADANGQPTTNGVSVAEPSPPAGDDKSTPESAVASAARRLKVLSRLKKTKDESSATPSDSSRATPVVVVKTAPDVPEKTTLDTEKETDEPEKKTPAKAVPPERKAPEKEATTRMATPKAVASTITSPSDKHTRVASSPSSVERSPTEQKSPAAVSSAARRLMMVSRLKKAEESTTTTAATAASTTRPSKPADKTPSATATAAAEPTPASTTTAAASRLKALALSSKLKKDKVEAAAAAATENVATRADSPSADTASKAAALSALRRLKKKSEERECVVSSSTVDDKASAAASAALRLKALALKKKQKAAEEDSI